MTPQQLLTTGHVLIFGNHDFLDPEINHGPGTHRTWRECGVQRRAFKCLLVKLAIAVKGCGLALLAALGSVNTYSCSYVGWDVREESGCHSAFCKTCQRLCTHAWRYVQTSYFDLGRAHRHQER